MLERGAVVHRRPRVALVDGELGVYWGQFGGLLDTLKRSTVVIAERITGMGVDVTDFDFVSDPIQGARASEHIRASDASNRASRWPSTD